MRYLFLFTFLGTSLVLGSIKKTDQYRWLVELRSGAKPPADSSIGTWHRVSKNYYLVETKNVSRTETFLKTLNSVLFMQKERLDRSQPSKLEKPYSRPESGLDRSATRSNEAPIFNDPGLGAQWAFFDQEEHGSSVSKAYKTHTTMRKHKIIVAVIDTGINFEHEDLREILWVNHREIPGNGMDDDHNGHIDDIYGINTLSRDPSGNATSNVMDTHSHGTSISGIIAASQNNSTGIAGVASNVEIMTLKTVPNRGDETDIGVVESLLYAAHNGAKIINCSFGKLLNEKRQLVAETIDHIGKEYGVLVVAAAGNSSSNISKELFFPASFDSPNLLSVAATEQEGGLAKFSSYSPVAVDVAAPGKDIFSTYRNNEYRFQSGTSVSAPVVSGIAAEILSRYPYLRPGEVKRIIMESTVHVPVLDGKVASRGRADLDKALTLAAKVASHL